MNGIIVVNKSSGCTSHDVVKEVKKIFNEKVGHTGTLDPMATGVLPLLIGKGTLCSKYLINHDKTYRVVLELGKKTDTADREGNIIEEAAVPDESLNTSFVKTTLKSFEGKQMQTPPIYSAIKVNGKKLYEYARKGLKVEVKPREIKIYKIELININKDNAQIEFKVDCSKGTYIRSLCEDIAVKLNTIGFMAELERLRVGEFDISQSIEIKDIKPSNLISIEELFKDVPNVELSENRLKQLLNGMKIKCDTEEINGPCKVYCNDKFVGIGVQKSGILKRDIII